MLNRRSFLTRAAAVVAGGSSLAPAATDQLVLGFIGTGGRANRHLIPSFKLYDNVRIAALCDVYKPNLEQAVSVAGGKLDTYGDYRRVLDRKDIDVVVIATPDHWHCPMVIEACEAGKDIYVEKPLSNDIDMCFKAVEAARKHNRVVQVGLQQRSSAPFLEAYKIVQSGILGKVRHVVVINPGGSARPGGGEHGEAWRAKHDRGLHSSSGSRLGDVPGAGSAAPVQPSAPAKLAQLLGVRLRPAFRTGGLAHCSRDSQPTRFSAWMNR